MKNVENRFKIYMILLFSLIFVVQIYYSVSLFISGLDMKTAVNENKLTLVYEAHNWLLTSRLVIALLQASSLNVNVMAAFMVLFLILGALNWIDIIYFGLILVSLYFAIQTKRASMVSTALSSFARLIIFIILVIGGGIAILNVFFIGNTSVLEITELGSTLIPIVAVVFALISILSFVFSIKSELRIS